MVKIVCFGDSIMEGGGDSVGAGWVTSLATQLSPEHRVFNLCISNSNTAELFQRFGEVLRRIPDVLIISASVNDCLRRTGTEPESTELSFMKLIEAWERLLPLMVKNIQHNLIVFPLDVDARVMPCGEDGMGGGTFDYDGYYADNSDLKRYRDMLTKLLVNYDVQVLDLNDIFSNDLFFDGLHPNTEGHALIAKKVEQKLKELKWLN